MKTYKLNNIEVSEVELKKLIQDNPELLKEENKSKYFTPGINEKYFHIFSDGEINVTENDSGLDKENIAMGVYRTKEEAELARDKQLALVRMWNYADEKMFFRPDWGNEEQEKYYVYYSYTSNCFYTGHQTCTQANFLLPNFKSLEDCDQFIDDNHKDLELFIK